MHKMASFKDIPSKIQIHRKIIFCGMDGCCRHVPTMKKLYKNYRVVVIDSSQPMLEYGAKFH